MDCKPYAVNPHLKTTLVAKNHPKSSVAEKQLCMQTQLTDLVLVRQVC